MSFLDDGQREQHEFKNHKRWLAHLTDVTKLHFVWLLDVFSFGLVNLIGTRLASCLNTPTLQQ